MHIRFHSTPRTVANVASYRFTPLKSRSSSSSRRVSVVLADSAALESALPTKWLVPSYTERKTADELSREDHSLEYRAHITNA